MNQVVSITPFQTKQSKALSMVLVLSSQTLLTHQTWRYPLMRLMTCLLWSLQDFYAWWVPFLIILDCSLLVAIHFYVSPSDIWFLASLPADSITLIFLIVRLTLLQWFMPLSKESILFWNQSCFVDTITSLHGSDGGAITALEVHGLLGFLTFWTLLCLMLNNKCKCFL